MFSLRKIRRFLYNYRVRKIMSFEKTFNKTFVSATKMKKEINRDIAHLTEQKKSCERVQNLAKNMLNAMYD